MTEGLLFRSNVLKGFKLLNKGTGFILDSQMQANKANLNFLLDEFTRDFPREDRNFHSIVVTGGGALLDGIIEEAEKAFKLPARIGMVRNPGRQLNTQDSIIHISTIGLINQLAQEYKSHNTHKSPVHRALHKVFDIYESYF